MELPILQDFCTSCSEGQNLQANREGGKMKTKVGHEERKDVSCCLGVVKNLGANRGGVIP